MQKSHWSWDKAKIYCKAMTNDENNYFICGLPNQFSIGGGLLSDEQVTNEITEDDFNEIGWQVEMDCLWFGSSQNCYFSFGDLDKVRTIMQTALPTAVLRTPKHEQKSLPPERNRETCLVVNDIAVMGGSKNDQTAHFVLLLVPPASCRYIRNVVYAETLIRTHTFGQSLKIRRLFYDFKADFVVLDTNGVGIGGYDNLVQEQDDEQIMTCSMKSCANDQKTTERCRAPDAPDVIYSIKASAQFNSDCAVMLRDGICQKNRF